MRVTWREQLQMSPSLQSLEQWPSLDVSSLPERFRKGFLRNRDIVACVLSGKPMIHVAVEFGVSQPRISQLMDRCLGSDDGCPPLLTRALIPHRNLQASVRRRELPVAGNRGGEAGCFSKLLSDVPGLQAGLDEMIEAKFHGRPYAQRLTPQTLHGEFKRLLAEANWPSTSYPFTNASCAYESVRRYLHARLGDLQLQQSGKMLQRSQPQLPRRPARPLQYVQLDEQVLDLEQSIHLEFEGQTIPLRTARASLLLLIDVATDCILGYYLAPTRHPSHQDLLALFDHCLSPWRPLLLQTPGLSYPPAASFPNTQDNPLSLRLGTVQLDNARMHLAHAIPDFLCNELGCALSYGLPAEPKTRHWVERAFHYVNQMVSHRPTSTVGSSPHDPKRENQRHRRNAPSISYRTLQEALDVALATHNATAQARLGGQAPLEMLRSACQNQYCCTVPACVASQWRPLYGSQEANVSRYRKEGRAPHVNFHYVRYQGAGLLRLPAGVKRIRIEFNRRDIRAVQAYTLDGQALGELKAPISWQRFPHSISTRDWLHRHAKKLRLHAQDPLAGYFRYLLTHKESPGSALSLLRVYEEFTADRADHLQLAESMAETDVSNVARFPGPRQKRTWSRTLANHR